MKTLKDGTVYDGEWYYGVCKGLGVCKYPDGSQYDGDWENG